MTMPCEVVEPPPKTPVFRTVLIAVAVQLALTIVAIVVKLDSGRDDTDIYFRYATTIREGKVPYRDFRVEYPALALPLFLAASLVSHDVAGFKFAFGLEMLLFNAATVWLVAAWVERTQGHERVRGRLAWYTVFYLLLSRLMFSRYDAAPTLLSFAASTWWFSGRPRAGGIAAALGTLMKVYPAVLALVAVPFDSSRLGRSRGRGLIAFVAVVVLGLMGWLAIGGARGVSESLGYQLARGFEYGSLGSGLQMLAARATGAEIDVIRDHAAWSSVTPWTGRLLPLVLPIQAATILFVVVAFVRRGMNEGVRYSGAAILAFIITGKVFSPQYLLWVTPFISVVEGPIARRASWLFGAGCAATLIAPALTASFPRTSGAIILAYNVKNALFLALLAILVLGPPAPTK
jgi:Glycosyltransferase family 87